MGSQNRIWLRTEQQQQSAGGTEAGRVPQRPMGPAASLVSGRLGFFKGRGEDELKEGRGLQEAPQSRPGKQAALIPIPRDFRNLYATSRGYSVVAPLPHHLFPHRNAQQNSSKKTRRVCGSTWGAARKREVGVAASGLWDGEPPQRGRVAAA